MGKCMKKNRNVAMAGLLGLLLMLSACAGDEKSEDQAGINFETIEVENLEETSDKKENPSEVSSLAEYLQSVDTEFLEDEESYIGTPAVNRFEKFLSDKNNWPESYLSDPAIGIALGFVDEDNVPELFISTGTNTTLGVHIYKYDDINDGVIHIGEFSQYGFCAYSPKKNRIWAQYGNNGYFEMYYCAIVDNKAQIVGRILSDAIFEEEKLYADYATDTYGSEFVDHPEPTDRPDDSFLISEEEYELKKKELMCSDEAIRVGYNEMTKLRLK